MQPDFILAFAEINIGILGFTGLIGVLSHEDWTQPAVFLRIAILIEFGTEGLFFALAPAPLLSMGIAPAYVWQNMAGLMALAVVAHFLIFGPRIVQLRRRKAWGMMPRLVNNSVAVALAGCFASSIAAILGLAGGIGPYSLALFFLTMAAVFNFVGLLLILRERALISSQR